MSLSVNATANDMTTANDNKKLGLGSVDTG